MLKQCDTFLNWTKGLYSHQKLFTYELKKYVDDSANECKELKNEVEEYYKTFIEQNVKHNTEQRFEYLKTSYDQIKEKDTYLIHSDKERILNEFIIVLQGINILKEKQDILSNELIDFIDETFDKLNKVQKSVEGYNQDFVEQKKHEYEPLFEKSPFKLDDNQKDAIIKDDKHNIVVAGAGSGKTEVLTTRIAYIINRKSDSIEPKRILALAFQRSVAREMQERLKEILC